MFRGRPVGDIAISILSPCSVSSGTDRYALAARTPPTSQEGSIWTQGQTGKLPTGADTLPYEHVFWNGSDWTMAFHC